MVLMAMHITLLRKLLMLSGLETLSILDKELIMNLISVIGQM